MPRVRRSLACPGIRWRLWSPSCNSWRRCSGSFRAAPTPDPCRLTALAECDLPSRRGRVDFLRGVFHCDPRGQLHVRSTGHQGSGILSSMVAANCLIEITADCETIAQGEAVTIQPFADICRGNPS
ncbi:hypothetical protein [Halomonas sp. BC04]|uniref:hypothetical protein n=1 Tax=Halomonas sp. BC04 TaxID=1403540 RepID=UPI002F361023